MYNNQIQRIQPPNQMGGSSLWHCQECSVQNNANAAVCIMCQQGKKINNPNMSQNSLMGGGYGRNQSPMYNQMNMNMNNPMMNNVGQQSQVQPNNNNNNNNKQDAIWECQSCTFLNSARSASCKICSNPQPKGNNNNNNNNNNPPQVLQQVNKPIPPRWNTIRASIKPINII